MSEPDDPRMPADSQVLRHLWPFLRPSLILYVIALAFAFVSAQLGVLQAVVLRSTLDDFVATGDYEGARWMALAWLLLVVLGFGGESLYTVVLSTAAMRTISHLRQALYARILAQSRPFFDRQPTGRLMTRVTSDIEALGEVLTAGAITIVLDVLNMAFVVVTMLLLDWRLTAVLMLLAPVLLVIVEVIRRALRRLYLLSSNAIADLNAYTAERFAGLQVVQLYSDEKRALAGYDRRLDVYRRTSVLTNVWDAALFAIIDGLTAVSMALMLWYATGHLWESVVTAGLLAAFIDLIARLFRPIQEFSAKVAILQRAGSSLEKVFGLLTHDQLPVKGEVPLPDPRGAIDIRGLSFAYGSGPDVLSDVTLHASPGETVAIVGRTGSGKSTLGRLLTRAYDGYRGSITIDGIELSRVLLADARRAIGTVSQDVQLFPADVRFNLTLGKPCEDERLNDVIGRVRATAVVDRLGGLGGTIKHSGSNVSVGEAQLLSMARTLAYDPRVVVLDEATANVDTLTEALLQEATAELLRGRTVFVIAHRLSTIVSADRIVLLDAGRVIEVGSHAALMAKGGAYAALFNEQFVDAGIDAALR